MTAAAMNWPGLLRLAALRFRLTPDQFWRLSVCEWRALTAPPAPEALSRDAFEALARAFPDEAPRP